jgi:hypothetical protein
MFPFSSPKALATEGYRAKYHSFKQKNESIMLEKIKQNLSGIIIIGAILTIGTCNYFLNTNHETEVYDNPKSGDYYVFDNFLVGSIYKLKEVKQDTYVFFLPKQEVARFKINKSESLVRDTDNKGEMFSEGTVLITKKDLDKMKESNTLSNAVDNKTARLEYVFR